MGFGYKGLVFCRNYGWLMENMDKTLGFWCQTIHEKFLQRFDPIFGLKMMVKSGLEKSLGFWWKRASLGVRSPWLLLFLPLPFCPLRCHSFDYGDTGAQVCKIVSRVRQFTNSLNLGLHLREIVEWVANTRKSLLRLANTYQRSYCCIGILPEYRDFIPKILTLLTHD